MTHKPLYRRFLIGCALISVTLALASGCIDDRGPFRPHRHRRWFGVVAAPVQVTKIPVAE